MKINKTETKIKYILVTDKIYHVTNTDFNNLIIEASETDLVAADVSPDELFDITDLKEFWIKLHNFSRTVIDFMEYCRNRESEILG